MGDSYRIKTELGINKSINIQLDQEFEFLEILSLKIQQTDIYTRSCADYGVLVGRVTANNGLGVPNARVSVFIPIEQVDESNPLINSIYPYKSPSDKNEDGYRYNLLPYEPSYSKHSATGTFPTREDVLTGDTAVLIYDKYYRFTSKTNESGDYMIMGVPLGEQTIVMDVDLSDIGEFSLTPQDLIRMGLATDSQVGGSFRSSNDLSSLPQIINLTKNVEISPLWGDPEICQISINRLDFDLRDDANIDIQPTSVFMGSMFSSADSTRIRKNCRPKDSMGNLCGLTTSPGQILCIRQTIQQDEDGNPILEEYELEQGGNIIDGSGTWLTELPMNLDYIITNEFGERVLSNDPSVGVPTKAKYRFKVKWTQPNDLTIQTRRAYYLVPNVKEYGWTTSTNDPTYSTNQTVLRQQQSSYYFGLNWSGYTNGFTGTRRIERLNEAINCEDTFYEFNYNKVYTVASLIDEYKKGAKGRFIGIKEIDDNSCENNINKFPVNDGFRNFDFLFFLFSILMVIIQPIGLLLLSVAHILLFLYNLVLTVICLICDIKIPIINVRPFSFICRLLNINCDKRQFIIRLPMITYPNCQACDCDQEIKTERNRDVNLGGNGVLSYLSSPDEYYNNLTTTLSGRTENIDSLSTITAEALAGFGAQSAVANSGLYKLPISQEIPSGTKSEFLVSYSLPIGERVNLFNQRNFYFEGINKIKVTFAKNSNIGKHHYDNTLTLLTPDFYEAGTLLSFVSPTGSTDTNYLYSADTTDGVSFGISGESYNGTGQTTVNVSYATSQTTNSIPITYDLPYGSENTKYQYPSDIEYYQVVTAITVSQASQIWNTGITETFGNILYTPSTVVKYGPSGNNWVIERVDTYVAYDNFTDSENQYILILQRGVDPYSPKYVNEYKLGNLFGKSEDDSDWTFTAETRLNIPIQKLDVSNISVQPYTQDGMYYESYFFKPGIDGSTLPGQTFTGYTTTNTAYYGVLDATVSPSPVGSQVVNNKVLSRTDNGFYLNTPTSSKYNLSEDLSGMGVMRITNTTPTNISDRNTFGLNYYTKTFFSTNPTLTISNRTKNILRTDRLPSSDGLDGGSWDNNPALLQQNNNFDFYIISEGEFTIATRDVTLGADIPTVDIEGLPNETTVIQSFDCENMVGLNCYTGFGSQFEVNQSCATKDSVERGCYVFVRRPLLDLIKDIANYNEWAYRFRFFYGICRGVLSQSFVNNWINGTLYAFPIQVDTFYNRENKVSLQTFCRDVVYFNNDSNNFYYRSSPYNDNTDRFIGTIPLSRDRNVNQTNLLFPTTVVDLGMKDFFYSEITLDPKTKGYVIPELTPTSYGDVSDLVNLFVISRITDSSFLELIFLRGGNSLQELFSRPQSRIDGDLAQLMSINSEIGNVKFSPEYYDNIPGEPNQPTNILGTEGDPIMAVWFSSTTEQLQVKDYLTPGRINFRGPDNNGYYPYPYGIKSQVVPFYQWKLDNTTTIFGNQENNWATNSSDIIQNTRYQSLDRFASDTPYFYGSNFSSNDLNARGYIFNVNGTVGDGQYTTTGALKSKFLVGAPFHFYFGAIKGETALDKFKTKYSIDE
jgi:hypothetical protein